MKLKYKIVILILVCIIIAYITNYIIELNHPYKKLAEQLTDIMFLLKEIK